jgi:SAM-dependent methyltransferase/acyl carrier protein
VYRTAGESYTVDDVLARGGVAPRYRTWMARALSALAAAGSLRRRGEAFESAVAFPPATAAPAAGAHRALVTAERLADVLTQAVHSAEIYAADSIPETYRTVFAAGHALVADVVRAVVHSLGAGEPLRILEVGAGYGTTTAHVLPLLPAERTTYVFTDLSRFFLQRAERELAAWPFVRYGLLDIDGDAEAQGYEAHGFDVVIAASVLHDARSVRDTLRSLRSLLAPNGLLVMVEETTFRPAFDLSMGLQQGFDRFEDTDLRPHHPLLSREGWQAALAAAGFVDSLVVPSADAFSDVLGLEVLVAQGPFDVTRVKTAALREFLASRLPDYMVPSVYVPLEALPLTANGKVDRTALPAVDTAPASPAATFVAPRTPLQAQLAGLWAGVLAVERVGIHDNFFEVGGDSLMAIKLISRLRQDLGVDLPLRRLFDSPTVAGLAESIETIRWMAGGQAAAAGDTREEGAL